MTRRRTITAILICSVLIQAITFLLRPASTYQALDLDTPGWALGLIGATFAIVPLGLAVPLGALADRWGERRLMTAGAITTTISCAVFLWASDSISGLVLANALLGAGHLACVLGQQSLVGSLATGRTLDSMFGYYTFAASLGQAAGPALIAVIGGSAVRPDTTLAFAVALGLAAPLIGSALAVSRSATSRSTEVARGSTRDLLRTPGLSRALVTSAVILSAVDLTIVYLPALGAERSYSAAFVGGLLTVRAVFSMASRLLLGRLTQWFGRTRVMVGSIVVSAVSLGVCALPAPWWLLLIAVAAAGLGLGVGQPITMSWLTERSPASMRARALSLRLLGNRAGQVVFPSILGSVAAGAGAAGAIAATAITLGATGALVASVKLDEP